MLFVYRLKKCSLGETVCSNSVEVTEQIGILDVSFK